jgi:excisionase family DNA binding protein
MTIIPDQHPSGEPPAVAEPGKPDPLLTTGEAAAVLEVVSQTIARWANDGTLPCTGRTPGGHRRFRTTAVQALRARLDNERGPGDATPGPQNRTQTT